MAAAGEPFLTWAEALEHVDFVMQGGVVYKAAGVASGGAGG